FTRIHLQRSLSFRVQLRRVYLVVPIKPRHQNELRHASPTKPIDIGYLTDELRIANVSTIRARSSFYIRKQAALTPSMPAKMTQRTARSASFEPGLRREVPAGVRYLHAPQPPVQPPTSSPVTLLQPAPGTLPPLLQTSASTRRKFENISLAFTRRPSSER